MDLIFWQLKITTPTDRTALRYTILIVTLFDSIAKPTHSIGLFSSRYKWIPLILITGNIARLFPSTTKDSYTAPSGHVPSTPKRLILSTTPLIVGHNGVMFVVLVDLSPLPSDSILDGFQFFEEFVFTTSNCRTFTTRCRESTQVWFPWLKEMLIMFIFLNLLKSF